MRACVVRERSGGPDVAGLDRNLVSDTYLVCLRLASLQLLGLASSARPRPPARIISLTSGDAGYALVAQVAPNGLWGSAINTTPQRGRHWGQPTSSNTGVIEGIGLLRTGNSYGSGTNYDKYAYVIVGLRRCAARGEAAREVARLHVRVPMSQPASTPALALQHGAGANGWLLRNSEQGL